MINTSIIGYFGVGNSFLTIDLKNNNGINGKFKMATLNLHIRKGDCGILCKCYSYKGIITNMILVYHFRVPKSFIAIVCYQN